MYKVAEASKRVWTSGCIEVIRIWAERNLYTIAGVALGVALSQVKYIYKLFYLYEFLIVFKICSSFLL